MAGDNECALLCFFLVGCSVFPTARTVVRPFTATLGAREGQLEAQDSPERISVESVLND